MERNGKGSFVHQYYKPTEIICGRQMKEWLPFSVSWWHNLGSQSMKGQFKHTSGILYEAEKAELAFEMMKRLDIEYFCLQGSGGCGPAENLLQTEEQQKRLNVIIEEKMNKYNSKLLWGAGNYISLEQTELGAGTSPSLDVFLQSLALEKINVDTVLQLNGTGIMFWEEKKVINAWQIRIFGWNWIIGQSISEKQLSMQEKKDLKDSSIWNRSQSVQDAFNIILMWRPRYCI